MRKIDSIILHHSGTRCVPEWTTSRIKSIHVNENNWSDIGYHFVIESDGSLHAGRPLNLIGAHCKGHNACSIGICIVGGFDSDYHINSSSFNPLQFVACRELIDVLCSIYDIPLSSVYLHRDFASTACPAFDLNCIMDSNLDFVSVKD